MAGESSVVGVSPRSGNAAQSQSTSAENFTLPMEGTHTMYAGPLRSVPRYTPSCPRAVNLVEPSRRISASVFFTTARHPMGRTALSEGLAPDMSSTAETPPPRSYRLRSSMACLAK